MKINQNEPTQTIFNTSFSAKTLFMVAASILLGAAVIYTGIQLSNQKRTATIQSRASVNTCWAASEFYVSPEIPTPTPTVTTPTPTPPVCVIPAKPTGLTSSVNLAAVPPSVTLDWSNVSGATVYSLQVDDTSDGWVGPNDTYLPNLTSSTYTRSVVRGRSYNWWVHAGNACGWSPAEFGNFTVPMLTTPTPTPRGPTPTRTPTPSSQACDRNNPNSRWATQLGLITTAGDVKTAKGWPYFDPKNPNSKYFLVNIPSGYSVAFLACYDCDHWGSGSGGWKISWTGGSFVAKTPNNVWGTWTKSISGPNTIKFDGNGDSHGGNVCINP